jgi:hypothetical protein
MKRLMAGGLSLLVVALTVVSVASAGQAGGKFEQFKECPFSIGRVTDCIRSVSSSGEFRLGAKAVPLKNPVTLQGGAEGEGEAVKFYGAENGETLSKTPQPVPGGLAGVVAAKWWPVWVQEWFNTGIDEGLTKITATVELSGPTEGLTDIKLDTENLLSEQGTALGLPVMIRLDSPLLGSDCYVGSESSPIQMDLTTGSSKGLSGSRGEESFNESFTLITIKGGRLVDGAYTAPVAHGCGGIFSFFVDPLVNSILGLPSGSGENAAVLEGVLEDAHAAAVKKGQ